MFGCNCAGDRLLENYDGTISHVCGYQPRSGPKNPKPPAGAGSGVSKPLNFLLSYLPGGVSPAEIPAKSCDCATEIRKLERRIAVLEREAEESQRIRGHYDSM